MVFDILPQALSRHLKMGITKPILATSARDPIIMRIAIKLKLSSSFTT